LVLRTIELLCSQRMALKLFRNLVTETTYAQILDVV
jgi:hypothetical protein